MTAVQRDYPPGLAEVLAFYAEAGVDEALSEEPVNRFAAATERAAEPARWPVDNVAHANGPIPQDPPAKLGRPPSATRSNAVSQSGDDLRPKPMVAVPDEQQAALARELASRAATLDELREAMASFDGCNLKFTAKNLVFADGNPEAGVMFVGEAPGRDEDIEGRPFVGRSGQLLDRMLAAIGLDRTSAYIANVIPWRPPGNRTPTPHETEICRPFIERQIELVAPKALVTLGGASAKVLLNTPDGIMRLRGNWRTYAMRSGETIPVMPTLHPAYLLRNPAHKRLAWRDFLEVKAKLRELGLMAPAAPPN